MRKEGRRREGGRTIQEGVMLCPSLRQTGLSRAMVDSDLGMSRKKKYQSLPQRTFLATFAQGTFSTRRRQTQAVHRSA